MDKQKREYKRKYIRRFNIVQSVINKWDPIGLFPGDAAPFDEYEPEIAQIVALLKSLGRQKAYLRCSVSGSDMIMLGIPPGRLQKSRCSNMAIY